MTAVKERSDAGRESVDSPENRPMAFNAKLKQGQRYDRVF